MEADWAVALAEDDPVIVVPWAAPGDGLGQCRFIDLRLEARLIGEIQEVQERPELGSALLLLNGIASQLWTTKCDAWTSSAERGDAAFDPYEMDTEPGETGFGAGSYIDLLARDAQVRETFAVQERWMRAVTESLRSISARGTRAELVMRRAVVHDIPGFGVTWFVEGCGSTADHAGQRWGEAFDRSLAIILETCLE
jgi:hypothetical protein